MASVEHESVVELFRNCTEAATRLLSGLHVPLPEYDDLRAESTNLTDLQPAEYRADLVLFLERGAAKVLGIIVEIQLGRNYDKRYTWPAYIANLRARHRCPVCLLVITINHKVARWAGKAITLGPGSHCQPLVAGPANIPIITRIEDAAANVELAVLSVAAHSKNTDTELASRIASVAFQACNDIDAERSKSYVDLLHRLLMKSPKVLENAMSSLGPRYQSDFARKYYGQGQVNIILKLLACRFGKLTDSVQAGVRGATDAELEALGERLLTAHTLEEALGALLSPQ